MDRLTVAKHPGIDEDDAPTPSRNARQASSSGPRVCGSSLIQIIETRSPSLPQP